MTTETTDATRAREDFKRAWRSLSGMFARQDKGTLTGRNDAGTQGTMRMRFADLSDALLRLDDETAATPKDASRYGYAERRLRLGRPDAESYKATCRARGEW